MNAKHSPHFPVSFNMPQPPQQKQSTVFNTIRDDVRNSHPYKSFLRESKELTDFYLTEEQRDELKRMKRIKGSFYVSGWVLKAMFYKLTPLRRLMFIIGVFLLVRVQASGGSFNLDGNALLGGCFLVLVILLELKDKLLAHDELEAGRKIQESLMPERTPAVNGWSVWLYTRSANEVCGDLVDFLRLEHDRFGIAMADVSGKGLHAALITAKLQATIRALAGEISTLPELIGRINTIVHRDSPSHIFSSLFYAECSESNGEIRYVNAGHFPALIVRNHKIEECEKGDAAIGLMAGVRFNEHAVELKTGEYFVLYSDGLTEAKNEQGTFFGKERFLELITAAKGTPENVGFAVLREVERFIGSSTPSDDLSLIIILKA